MFSAMDQDGDGFFTLDDMTRVMGAMMDEDDPSMIFKMMDFDKDGLVNRDEF